jgi:hypothetical protein
MRFDMKIWCVKVSYWYDQEAPRDTLECDVKLFSSKKAAVDELERVIREDWTTEVEVDGETKRLSDCRGMQEGGSDSSRKYCDWYYSEDGTLAWTFFWNSHGYKGEVVEVDAPDIGEQTR